MLHLFITLFISGPDSPDCETLFEEIDEFQNKSISATLYGTKLQYKCPLAQKFNRTEEFQEMTCQWNKTWYPTDELIPCLRENSIFANFTSLSINQSFPFNILAYGCANPFQPNMSTTHVKMSTDFEQDLVYLIGESVYYICQDGNEALDDRLYFFDDDMDRSNFSITCFDNGTWSNYPNITCVNKNGKL